MGDGWSDDPELRTLFLREAEDTIEAMARGMGELDDPSVVDDLIQRAHRLKGSAAVVGFTDVVDVADGIEEQLVELRDGRLDDGTGLHGDVARLRRVLDATLVDVAGGEAAAPDRRSRRRVLVVDDDAVVRELLRRMLEGGGHEVLVAEDAAGALVLVDGAAVDLVIADVEMPGTDGLALIASIGGRAPVALCTGHDVGDEDARRYQAAGAVAWVSKRTLDRSTLLDLVDRAARR